MENQLLLETIFQTNYCAHEVQIFPINFVFKNWKMDEKTGQEDFVNSKIDTLNVTQVQTIC